MLFALLRHNDSGNDDVVFSRTMVARARLLRWQMKLPSGWQSTPPLSAGFRARTSSRVQNVLRPTFFAQQIGRRPQLAGKIMGHWSSSPLLPREADHARVKQIAVALRWIRKLEGQSAAEAARKAGHNLPWFRI